jgi:hypothetical protein
MEIYVHQHNIEHIVNDKEFNEHLTKVLNEYRDEYVPEPGDTGEYSSTSKDNSIFLRIDNRQYITNWLREVISDYFSEKGVQAENIQVNRCWCNRVRRNTKVKPHTHAGQDTDTEKVVILYYEAPENSSKFVLVNSNERLNSYDEYDYEDLQLFAVKPGMAIIHDADVLHATTEHNSDEPRTIFVFDIKINGKDEHSVA